MADLYRKSALERISNPEQLDKALKITSPLSWLALLAITGIIAATIVWSVIGSIPTTVTSPGIIASPDRTNAVYADGSGTVLAVLVHEGEQFAKGTAILSYSTGNHDIKQLLAPYPGTVSGISVQSDDKLIQGKEVLRITPQLYFPENDQVAVCYVPLAQANKMEVGMTARIFMDAFDSQTYGYMEGKICCIDSYVSKQESMQDVLGENSLSADFVKNGSVVAVTLDLLPDASAVSGFWWSTDKGAALTVGNSALVTVKVETDTSRPIEKLFSKLKDIWGD